MKQRQLTHSQKRRRIKRFQRRRNELADALRLGYEQGEYLYTDMCIAMNELEVAYEHLAAPFRLPVR